MGFCISHFLFSVESVSQCGLLCQCLRRCSLFLNKTKQKKTIADIKLVVGPSVRSYVRMRSFDSLSITSVIPPVRPSIYQFIYHWLIYICLTACPFIRQSVRPSRQFCWVARFFNSSVNKYFVFFGLWGRKYLRSRDFANVLRNSRLDEITHKKEICLKWRHTNRPKYNMSPE